MTDLQTFRADRVNPSLTRHLASPYKFTIKNDVFLGVVEVLFFIFMLLVLVHILDGAADNELARRTVNAAIKDGDLGKQISYTFLFLLFVVFYASKNSLTLPRCLSIFQVLTITWLLLSCSWASNPELAFRRCVLMAMIVFGVAMAIDLLGIRRSFRCIYFALGAVEVVSVLTVPFFSFAKHPYNEVDASIRGCWRGVMQHKNVAGAVASLATMVFLHHGISRNKWYDWVFMLFSIAMLVGSRSKTSGGFAIPMILFGLAFRTFWATPRGRIWFLLSLLATLAIGVFLGLIFESRIEDVFDDPKAFSGRVEIWQTALQEVRDHPFIGSGFSSFWRSGPASDIYKYLTSPFLEYTLHSHNGFLETAVVGGVIGLALAVTACVIIPLKQVFAWNSDDLQTRAILFTIVVTSISENMLETQFYNRDREVWTLYCAAVCMLQLWTSERKQRLAAGGEGTRRQSLRAPGPRWSAVSPGGQAGASA